MDTKSSFRKVGADNDTMSENSFQSEVQRVDDGASIGMTNLILGAALLNKVENEAVGRDSVNVFGE